jgi:hypothetical protein
MSSIHTNAETRKRERERERERERDREKKERDRERIRILSDRNQELLIFSEAQQQHRNSACTSFQALQERNEFMS